jgi:signal transduction histidine kinase
MGKVTLKGMFPMPEQPKLTPEMLVPRIGEYLISQGKITEDDLQKALAYQQEQVALGQSHLLGETLVELGMIERGDLDGAVTELILQLRSALQAANRTLERRVEERTIELQNALHRLNELNELKANFVSNISHELRTPLTHMKGYVELLVTESLGPLTNEQKHALQVSQRSTTRLESLIDDLIMFSMASRGELSLKQERTDIRRLVNLCIKSAQQKAESRGVTVHTVSDDDLPSVQVDSQKFSWVISQLLDNAIKFTPSGGRVVVNLKRESEKLVSVSVTDTGIGIPAERLDEVFQPFHQLDSSSTRKYGGTGLGLSLVREIIEAHGSMIEVDSVEGRGTTFKFPLLISPGQA